MAPDRRGEVANDCRVIFTPSGRRGSFPAGTSLLAAARSLGVDIDSVCGGRGLCGRCQITVGSGEFAKFAIVSRPDHLSAAGEIEAHYTKCRRKASSTSRSFARMSKAG
ncbi:MAG: 2Fe-2S iron-sulfur cluster-binding protein [Alphaproteobacteria bacterium]